MTNENNEKKITEPIVSLAIELIKSDFPRIEGIEDLAEKISVSKCHLIRCFTAHIGISPGKYLTNIRIEAAKQDLSNDEYTIEMIAGRVGYACGNYFSKVFRKATGMSPSAYRRTQRAVNIASNKIEHSRVSDDIFFV